MGLLCLPPPFPGQHRTLSKVDPSSVLLVSSDFEESLSVFPELVLVDLNSQPGLVDVQPLDHIGKDLCFLRFVQDLVIQAFVQP